MRPGDCAHFLLRATRRGPLVPARIRLLDHAPGDPAWNKLDRGRLSHVLCADIAGEEIDPERMLDRLMSTNDWRPAHAPAHWRYVQPITTAEYDYRIARMKWARDHRPSDPTATPQDAVDPTRMDPPIFADQEESA